MYGIKQYRPGYFTGFENKTIAFEDKDELLDIEFVREFERVENFYRYSLANEDGLTLMAEYKEGKEWYVIGHIIGDGAPLDLPYWKPPSDHPVD